MTTASDFLNEAREYIETHGHHKGAFEDNRPGVENPPACAMGAMHKAWIRQAGSAYTYEVGHAYAEAMQRLTDQAEASGVIADSSFTGYEAIITWNDAKETTAEDVILGFKKAAELED